LKNVEDMEGNSKCVKFLEQLKVSNVSQKTVSLNHVLLKNVDRPTRAQGAIMSDSEESEFGADPTAEETAILERAVALTTPAAAKKAATQVIAAKKAVRF
jgi:hypothetical protein